MVSRNKWKAIEWNGPNETVIDGKDGTFQVFVDDGFDETWVCDADSLAAAQQIAAEHNKNL